MKKSNLTLILIFVCTYCFSQNYSGALGTSGYLTCDELEETIVKKTKFKKGWDNYELKSSFLEKVKFYESKFFYTFALVKFKDNESTYVFCGISDVHSAMFEVFLGKDGHSTGKLFHEYISPYKCDCK